jgi:hypothetical protein
MPAFTAPIRGHAGIHGRERWKVVLSNEASLSYRLSAAVAKLGPLGRALGAPPPAPATEPTLEAWVHFHDIFLPDDYHDAWIFEEGLSWNEQYVLQAFLMHNDASKVRFASHMLVRTAPEELAAAIGPDADGGRVWLERVA